MTTWSTVNRLEDSALYIDGRRHRVPSYPDRFEFYRRDEHVCNEDCDLGYSLYLWNELPTELNER